MDVTTEPSVSRFHEPSIRQKKVFIMRVGDFLARRHKMRERGARRFLSPALPREKGIPSRTHALVPRAGAQPVGEPDTAKSARPVGSPVQMLEHKRAVLFVQVLIEP